jgi:hypothetical protein
MMDAETVLTNEAAKVAERLQSTARALEPELLQIEKRKIEIDATLHVAHLSRKRLLDFRVRRETNFQCPRCWIEREAPTALTQIPGTASDVILRCHFCGADYVIPLR